MKAKIILILFLVETLGVIVVLHYQAQGPQGNGQPEIAADFESEGNPAPDFVLNDPAGRPVGLGEYRGKVVLLGFWTTW
jgi:cytochrome oxidase Cu insertion factor (SCO1/SenC/PrrC family)